VTFSPVRRLILASSAAVLAAGAAIITPAVASAQPSCPDVEIVFARGTSEPVGVGRVGQALADALAPQLGGRSLGTYGVNYPAGYDFLTTADGAADATAHIVSMAQQCPGTSIVLGGYSQGAAVVDMLAGVPPLGDRVGSIGSAPPLPGSAAGNVAAVVVFGNPATKFGNPVSAAGSFSGKALDLCSDGDPICSDGRNPFAHTHYESSAFISQAANFVAGRV
jgi:cutinase